MGGDRDPRHAPPAGGGRGRGHRNNSAGAGGSSPRFPGRGSRRCRCLAPSIGMRRRAPGKAGSARAASSPEFSFFNEKLTVLLGKESECFV